MSNLDGTTARDPNLWITPEGKGGIHVFGSRAADTNRVASWMGVASGEPPSRLDVITWWFQEVVTEQTSHRGISPRNPCHKRCHGLQDRRDTLSSPLLRGSRAHHTVSSRFILREIEPHPANAHLAAEAKGQREGETEPSTKLNSERSPPPWPAPNLGASFCTAARMIQRAGARQDG